MLKGEGGVNKRIIAGVYTRVGVICGFLEGYTPPTCPYAPVRPRVMQLGHGTSFCARNLKRMTRDCIGSTVQGLGFRV